MKRALALAADVERTWKAARFSPGALPEIAGAALEKSAMHRGFAWSSVIEDVRRSDAPPRASHGYEAPEEAPVFPLAASKRLAVDLNAYGPSLTSIHDHDFDGAAMVLEGTAVFATYAFDDAESVADHLRAGSLRVDRIDRAGPGYVSPIHAGPRTIHRVLHASDRTVILLVRGRPRRGQSLYFDAGLSIRAFAERPPAHEARASMLGFLAATEPAKAGAFLSKLLATSDAWSTASFLLSNWAYLDETGALERTLRACRRRLGPWVDRLASVHRETTELGAIRWASLDEAGRLRKRPKVPRSKPSQSVTS